jgi:hypothetical protein
LTKGQNISLFGGTFLSLTFNGDTTMPCGKKRKRRKIATHKRKKRRRRDRHKKKLR